MAGPSLAAIMEWLTLSCYDTEKCYVTDTYYAVVVNHLLGLHDTEVVIGEAVEKLCSLKRIVTAVNCLPNI